MRVEKSARRSRRAAPALLSAPNCRPRLCGFRVEARDRAENVGVYRRRETTGSNGTDGGACALANRRLQPLGHVSEPARLNDPVRSGTSSAPRAEPAGAAIADHDRMPLPHKWCRLDSISRGPWSEGQAGLARPPELHIKTRFFARLRHNPCAKLLGSGRGKPAPCFGSCAEHRYCTRPLLRALPSGRYRRPMRMRQPIAFAAPDRSNLCLQGLGWRR